MTPRDITLDDYFGPRRRHAERTLAVEARAMLLLWRVNRMLAAARAAGWVGRADPDTGTLVSGAAGGQGDGGWRPSEATTGATRSAHRRAGAVDIYDPDHWLARWLTDARLEEFGLYREDFEYTPSWCHVQDEPPGSHRRVFVP